MGLSNIKPIRQPGEKVEDVSQLVADITSKDSAIMRRAGARGLQVANSRGLINSTMGVQASQAAVLDQAIPMASQNASQNYGSNASKQQTDQQMGLNQQGLDLDRQRITAQTEATSQLNNEGFENDKGRITAQTDAQSRLNSEGLANDTAKITAQTEAQSRLNNEGFENDRQQQVSDQQFTASQSDANREVEIRKSADTMTANIFNDYQAQEASIMNNPDIPADERAQLLANAKNLSEARIQTVNTIYDTNFQWPASFNAPSNDLVGTVTDILFG